MEPVEIVRLINNVIAKDDLATPMKLTNTANITISMAIAQRTAEWPNEKERISKTCQIQT